MSATEFHHFPLAATQDMEGTSGFPIATKLGGDAMISVREPARGHSLIADFAWPSFCTSGLVVVRIRGVPIPDKPAALDTLAPVSRQRLASLCG